MDNTDLGDLGCSILLEALAVSGSISTLQHLSLGSNGLTMCGGSLLIISSFTQLRSLDLSNNFITLDVSQQRETFKAALKALTVLESLSMAYNRIQDNGMSELLKILEGMWALRLLDISYCFITGKHSVLLMEYLIRLKSPKLEIILCEGNIFCPSEKKGLILLAEQHSIGFTFEERPRITFPIQKKKLKN